MKVSRHDTYPDEIFRLGISLLVGWKDRKYKNGVQFSKKKRNRIKYTDRNPPIHLMGTLLWILILGVMLPSEWSHKKSHNENYYCYCLPIVRKNSPHNVNKKYWTSNKLRNRNTRMINGNRAQFLRILHWNLGSRQWPRKLTELEALLTEKKLDICFVSEANLWQGLDPQDREIPGHYLILPLTLDTMGHARIVCIVKNELNVHVLKEHMD